MMRKIFLAMQLFVATILFSQEIGDKITDIQASHNFNYVKETELKIPAFPELKFAIMSYSPDLSSPALLCSIVNGKIDKVFGALCGESPNAFFLIDTSGLGYLDYKTSSIYLPNWILFSVPMKRSNPIEFINMCNDLYKKFNSINGPIKDDVSNMFNIELSNVKDTTANNRDLYYSMMSYTYQFKNSIVALGIMSSITQYVAENYDNSTSPLFLLYTGECLINLGKNEEAKSIFKTLKEIDQKSLIADFYLSQLNDTIEGSTKNIQEFKMKNPNFWTLK